MIWEFHFWDCLNVRQVHCSVIHNSQDTETPKCPLERCTKMHQRTERNVTLPWKDCSPVNGPEHTMLSQVRQSKTDSAWPHWHVESNTPTPSSQTQQTGWGRQKAQVLSKNAQGVTDSMEAAATTAARWELLGECISEVLTPGRLTGNHARYHVNWTCCADHFRAHTNIQSLCCLPEANMLRVNYAPERNQERDQEQGGEGKRRKQRLLKGQRTSLTIHDFFQRYFLGKTVFKITLQPKPQVGRHGGSTGEGRPGVSGVMAKSRAPLPPSSAVSPAPFSASLSDDLLYTKEHMWGCKCSLWGEQARPHF